LILSLGLARVHAQEVHFQGMPFLGILLDLRSFLLSVFLFRYKILHGPCCARDREKLNDVFFFLSPNHSTHSKTFWNRAALSSHYLLLGTVYLIKLSARFIFLFSQIRRVGFVPVSPFRWIIMLFSLAASVVVLPRLEATNGKIRFSQLNSPEKEKGELCAGEIKW
jgi:hypothetical protein